MTGRESVLKTILRLRHVRLAVGIIPLCLTGIVLIFYLKPHFGASISGLAILTVSIQAMAALIVVLFFTALREYLKFKDSNVVILQTPLDEDALLRGAFHIGRRSLVDTAPNPEHKEEWIQNVRTSLAGSLMDFLDAHPVPARNLSSILGQTERGFRELLEADHSGKDETLSLSMEEILELVPLIFQNLDQEPRILKRLQPAPSIIMRKEEVSHNS